MTQRYSLSVSQGPDERDIQTLPTALQIVMPIAPEVRGLKFAFNPNPGYFVVDPEVGTNTRAAIETLRDLGAEIDEIDPGLSYEFDEAARARWRVYFAVMYAEHIPKWRDAMCPRLVRTIEKGLERAAVEYKRLEFVQTNLWRRMQPVFSDYSALLCPRAAGPAPPSSLSDSDFSFLDSEGRYHGLELTEPFTLIAQCPALSVPSRLTSAGLPTGLQIVGRRYDELTVLGVGKALEEALGWPDRHPPI